MVLRLFLLLLTFIPLVLGQCGFGLLPDGVNGGLASLSDLRSPTPLTYIGVYTALNCANDPAAISLSYTVSLSGNFYFAPLQVITVVSQGVYFATYPFPGLIVTSLTPGEILTAEAEIVLQPLDGSPPVGTAGLLTMQVPPTITLTPGNTGSVPTRTNAGGVPGAPTTDGGLGGDTSVLPTLHTPARTTTATITVPASTADSAASNSSSSSSSVPVGGIVGGVVGAAVLLTALGAFVWYRSRTKRNRNAMYDGGINLKETQAPPPPPPPPPQPMQTRAQYGSQDGGRSGGYGPGYVPERPQRPERQDEGTEWMRYYPNLRQQNIYE